jgi:hypothetical protein
VQQYTPNTESAALGKLRSNGAFWSDELDPVKSPCFASIQRNAQPSQNIQAVRHQSFSACLIDWRLCAVSDYHPQSMLACGNGRSKASRAAANYKYVCI